MDGSIYGTENPAHAAEPAFSEPSMAPPPAMNLAEPSVPPPPPELPAWDIDDSAFSPSGAATKITLLGKAVSPKQVAAGLVYVRLHAHA